MLTLRDGSVSLSVLLLCCCTRGDARISPKVIALQQGLYDELRSLEKGALITNLHASPDGKDAHGQVRRVFHEFERQNQESITAILRVLALVDHTLENTIKDCGKIFDLPSLESDNVLFREITRSLLLRVEQLCQQIASEELTGLEATMEGVEQEANAYRARLDDTRVNMRAVLEQLDARRELLSIAGKIDRSLHRMQRQSESARRTIEGAAEKFLFSQRSVGDAILQSTDDSEDVLLITNFMMAVENETHQLVDDLEEQLEMVHNQTESTLYMIAEEVKAIFHNSIESPASAFLEGESSLQCLAEYYRNFALQNVQTGLEDIFDCFNVDGAPTKPLEMVELLFERAENDVELILQGLLECYQQGNASTYSGAESEVISCVEAANPILDATEEFVEAKMSEIFFHVEDAMNFEELKVEACLYYKARELMMSEEFINVRYLKCNGAGEPALQESFDGGQLVPV